RDVRPAAWCAHLEAGGASATWRLLLEFSTEDGRELDCILGALGEHIPAEFERVGSRLTLSSPPCAPLDAQTDLVHALAAYPRLSWARWTIWCDAGTGEAMRAQGTDASDLLAIVRAPR
ncbi:MAG TPA: hypothetical protein VI319_12230, partial [Burkholderiales bacterium]